MALLAKAGWHVIASTGRPEEADYLKGLGAAEILDRSELAGPSRPLAKERWAAGVDTVGSTTLANVLSMTKYGGAIAACGLAGGMDLPTTVAPFILRNVALLGVDSVMAPKALRIEAWNRIAHELDHDKLAAMTSTIPLDGVLEAGKEIVAGKYQGPRGGGDRALTTLPGHPDWNDATRAAVSFPGGRAAEGREAITLRLIVDPLSGPADRRG